MRNLRSFAFVLLFTLLSTACTRDGSIGSDVIILTGRDGREYQITQQDNYPIRVLIFMNYDCPLSINYTSPMTSLVKSHQNDSVAFYFVFPGYSFANDSVNDFVVRYGLHSAVLFDPEYKLCKAMGAKVTPQVIILDADDHILYTGAFDNWAFEPGRKRQVVTEHYAEDALKKIAVGLSPDPAHTEPIGCFIEY